VSGRRGSPADLGGFDPRFLGITLRFASPEEWGRFRAETYAASVSQLATLPEDEAFTLMAEMTVLQHELRHFHDFLLSPYGQRLFRLKLQAFFNGFQALVLLLRAARQQGANCLPIPLSRWCRMPDDQRRTQIAQWNRGPKKPVDGGGWRPPDVPGLPEAIAPADLVLTDGRDPLATLLAATVRAYDNIGELLRNPNTAAAVVSLQPWHVMEVSALLVQMQEIANTLGPDAAYRFVDHLPRSGFPDAAVRLFRALDQPWRVRELAPGAADLSAVVAWALMGHYEKDGWQACPTERIERLFDHLLRQGPPPPEWPLRRKFQDWSDATGLSEPFDALRWQVDSNRALVARYQSPASDVPEAQRMGQAAPVLDAAKTLHAATALMRQTFEADPDGYVSPERYLDRLDRYPRPLIRCEFDTLFLTAAKLSPQVRKNWIVVFARTDTQGRRFLRTGVLKGPLPGIKVIDPSAGIKLYAEVLDIDYLFQPHNRLDWEFGEVVHRLLATELGLFPLHITG
jgi:hypothetical protein